MQYTPPRFIQDAEPVSGFDFAPDERIGRAPPSRWRRVMRRLLLVAVVAGGGALAWTYPAETTRLATGALELAQSLLTRPDQPAPSPAAPAPRPELAATTPPAPAATPRVVPPVAAAPEPAPTSQVPAPPAAAAGTAATLAEPAPAADPPAAEAEPTAPPPPPAYVDPLQARAERIGLHPDLSPSILRRLAEADWQNAARAIAKALAETPDEAVLVWPPKREPGRAQFQIEFVPGSAPRCRRYVVTLARDGWASTALPMEKCGLTPPPSQPGPKPQAAAKPRPEPRR